MTGTVGGDAKASDTVTLTVGEQTYSGTVGDDLTYAIDVQGSVLAENDTVYAEVSGTDEAGNAYSAETGRDYGVNLDASATITIDTIAGDDVINDEEAQGDVRVTGTVNGDAQAGDTVTLTVGDDTYEGEVVADDDGNLTYAIDVPGEVLANNDTVTAEVTGTDPAGNPYRAETGRDYAVSLENTATLTSELQPGADEDGATVAYTVTVNRVSETDQTFTFDVDGEAQSITVRAGDTTGSTSYHYSDPDVYWDENVISAPSVLQVSGDDGSWNWNLVNNAESYELDDTIDVTTVTLGALVTKTSVIDVTNLDKSDSFKVSAFGTDGNPGEVSKVIGTNHDGFGVKGPTSGSAADSELGYGKNGVSEKIVIDFNHEVESFDVQFAWRNNSEKAKVEFKDADGNSVGYAIVSGGGTSTEAKVTYYDADGKTLGEDFAPGGSDRVDQAYKFKPEIGKTFVSAEFTAVGYDDDYLIHSIAYKEVVKDGAASISGESEVVFEVETSNPPDPSQYTFSGSDFPTAIVEIDGVLHEVTLDRSGKGTVTVNVDGENDLVARVIEVNGNFEKVDVPVSLTLVSETAESDAVAQAPTVNIALGEVTAIDKTGTIESQEKAFSLILGDKRGDGNIAGSWGYDYSESDTQTFDFGKAHAGQEVTITIPVNIRGTWNSGHGVYDDNWVVKVNGGEEHVFDDYGSPRNYYLNENHTETFTANLDGNGKLRLDFSASTTETTEIAIIKGATATVGAIEVTEVGFYRYDVDLSAALNDTDGNETLSIRVTGVPEGSTLSQGALQSDGSWLIQASGEAFESDGLTLTVPAALSGQDIKLVAEAIATELNATDEADRTANAFAETATKTVPTETTTPEAPDNAASDPVLVGSIGDAESVKGTYENSGITKLHSGYGKYYSLGGSTTSVDLELSGFGSHKDAGYVKFFQGSELVGWSPLTKGSNYGFEQTLANGKSFDGIMVVNDGYRSMFHNETFTIKKVAASIDTGEYEYALNVSAALTDTDGSESLSDVMMTGIPRGVRLEGDGVTQNVDGSYMLALTNGSAASNVKLLANRMLGSEEVDSITLAVTSTEQSNGETSTVTAKLDHEAALSAQEFMTVNALFTDEQPQSVDEMQVMTDRPVAQTEEVSTRVAEQVQTESSVGERLELSEEEQGEAQGPALEPEQSDQVAQQGEAGQPASEFEGESQGYTLAEDEALLFGGPAENETREGESTVMEGSQSVEDRQASDGTLGENELLASEGDDSVDSWLSPGEQDEEPARPASSAPSDATQSSEAVPEVSGHTDYVKLHDDYSLGNSEI
ncbi:Ig-like domain-containing protein [Vreelandella sp. EE22]